MQVEWRRVGAYVVCRDSTDRLLLTRFVSETHPHSGRWAMPGGGMEWGETAAQTAARELDEETGLTATIGPVLGVYSRWFTPAESARGDAGHHLGIVFDTSNLSGELRSEFAPGTTDAAEWFTLDEIQTLPHVDLVDYVLSLLAS